MVEYDVPIFFSRSPDFALGRQDLYATLGPVLEPQGVTRDEADQAFAAVV